MINSLTELIDVDFVLFGFCYGEHLKFTDLSALAEKRIAISVKIEIGKTREEDYSGLTEKR